MSRLRDSAGNADTSVPVEQAHGPVAERRRDDPTPAEGHVVGAHRYPCLAHEVSVEAVPVHDAVVAAGDEDLLPREGDVLRRSAGGEYT